MLVRQRLFVPEHACLAADPFVLLAPEVDALARLLLALGRFYVELLI